MSALTDFLNEDDFRLDDNRLFDESITDNNGTGLSLFSGDTTQDRSQSIFGDIPEVKDMGGVEDVPRMKENLPMRRKDMAPNLIPQVGQNAAQAWMQNAPQARARPLEEIAANNKAMLQSRGGTGRTTEEQSQRYYTRKMYREIANSKNASPEARLQARLGLRIEGARTPQPGAGLASGSNVAESANSRYMGPTSAADWNKMFLKTRSNNFGEDLPSTGGARFNPKTGMMEAPRKPVVPFSQGLNATASVDDIIQSLTA